MSESVILWILGIAVTLIVPVVGYLAHRISSVERGLADFRAEVPVRYANEGDIQRVEKVIEGLRHEVTQFMHEQRQSSAQIAATLNQLVGANAHRG